MKHVFGLFFFFFLLVFLNTKKISQSKLQFGANASFTDTTLNKLIDNNVPINLLKKEFNLQYLRYPGGSPTRYFLWENNKLTNPAMILYSKRFKTKNEAKAKHVERLSKKIEISDSAYFDFISYCKKNQITPIIQLNSFSYVYQNNVYPISKLSYEDYEPNNRPNKWDEISKTISEQLITTHSYLDTVYWEIGNEDYHIYDPEIFGKIVSIYSKLIKDNFPQDKVLVPAAPMSSNNFGYDWMVKLFNFLEEDNALGRIDFLAPHYYKDKHKEISNQRELEKIIKRVSIRKRIKDYKNLIKRYSNKDIKLFFTEFTVFRRFNENNFNTQLHALLFSEYIMQFYSDETVFGVIHHGFTQRASALFFEKGVSNSLGYVQKSNSNNLNFPYIPPQLEILKIFFDNIKKRDFKIIQKNNLTIMVTENNDVHQIVILNYGNKEINLKIDDLKNNNSSISDSKSYFFNDLDSHFWYSKQNHINVEFDSDSNSVRVKNHSLTFINF